MEKSGNLIWSVEWSPCLFTVNFMLQLDICTLYIFCFDDHFQSETGYPDALLILRVMGI